MRATRMLADAYGTPDELRPHEVELADPGPGELTISVRAAGLNPADFKAIAGMRGRDESALPLSIGYEVAGVIAAIGPDTEIASGGGAVGDEVLAFRVSGGYASALTVPASDVFAKPESLGFPEAANLLLAGSTAADMLRVVPVSSGQTVVVHGASGAVGVSLLQQLRELGVRAIGTASQARFEEVARFGGEPVAYGDGLEQRVRELAPDGVDAAYDCVGKDEAVDVSLALVSPERIVTIAAHARAQAEGFFAVGGNQPESAAFRDGVRAELVERAGRGEIEVPVARTFPLLQAAEALSFLAEEHPGGKLALIP